MGGRITHFGGSFLRLWSESKTTVFLLIRNYSDFDGLSQAKFRKNRNISSRTSQIKIISAIPKYDTLKDRESTRENSQVLKAGDPVITYVARNLEPYRGFHVFMRALESIKKEHKTCHAVIVGGDDVSYGSKPIDASNWREKMLREVRLDPTLTHFMGKRPYETYKTVLQISSAHVYLTYPFVLSWSLLEAQASGCLVIGSDTPPVCEVIEHGRTGQLVPFHEPSKLKNAAIQALQMSGMLNEIKRHARTQTINLFKNSTDIKRYNEILDATLINLV